jgi:hypothetical protein
MRLLPRIANLVAVEQLAYLGILQQDQKRISLPHFIHAPLPLLPPPLPVFRFRTFHRPFSLIPWC